MENDGVYLPPPEHRIETVIKKRQQPMISTYFAKFSTFLFKSLSFLSGYTTASQMTTCLSKNKIKKKINKSYNRLLTALNFLKVFFIPLFAIFSFIWPNGGTAFHLLVLSFINQILFI